ncbi:MAG: hypothetical protein IJP23_06305 [Oscillospiraceae bacterium]|nr:hypothetical protein [Oscillospiraceae bacterium]
MKKIVCILLVVVMMFALAIGAGAVTATPSAPANGEVTITVETQDNSGIVYSINIEWDSLNFKYDNGTGTWLPASHTYQQNDAGWVANTSGGQELVDSKVNSTVTVTNHSNAPIWYTAEYTKDGTPVAGVEVSLSSAQVNVNIPAGVVGDTSDPSNTKTFEVVVGGDPGEAALNGEVDGNLTITIFSTSQA